MYYNTLYNKYSYYLEYIVSIQTILINRSALLTLTKVYKGCKDMVEEEASQPGGSSSPRDITLFDPVHQTTDEMKKAAEKFLTDPKVSHLHNPNLFTVFRCHDNNWPVPLWMEYRNIFNLLLFFMSK